VLSIVLSVSNCKRLCAYYVLRLAELSASDCKNLVCRLCKKALCCDLTQGRRIWRGACKSLVLCRVGFLGSVLIEY
jgi:hypothetical protein